jgi:hypothetical protein
VILPKAKSLVVNILKNFQDIKGLTINKENLQRNKSLAKKYRGFAKR